MPTFGCSRAFEAMGYADRQCIGRVRNGSERENSCLEWDKPSLGFE
jgi:hypothetical protein